MAPRRPRRPRPARRWSRPGVYDHVLMLVAAAPGALGKIREHLSEIPGRSRPAVRGNHPRFRIVSASNGDEAVGRATEEVTVAAVDLLLPRPSGLELVQTLRARRPDLALLAFAGGAPADEAVAAIMAGVDYFHELRPEPDPRAFERALELAIDRRRLSRTIERSEADVAAARAQLAELATDRARALPGFRLPHSREEVLPFKEAARRYLDACAHAFEGDAAGLARRLGVSYFALRRLLVRYGVPLPSRSRRHGTGGP